MNLLSVAGAPPGLRVIGIFQPPGTGRDTARARVRLALRELAAQVYEVAMERIGIDSAPGLAPRLVLDGQVLAAGVSISHEEDYSVAALYPDGPVGIDLMRVQDIDDWKAVARNYLGPQVLAELAACAPAGRALALARAWTVREARLKCLGQPLAEWSALPDGLACLDVAVPEGWVATLAHAGGRR
ncbi:MAG: 4'-phosphopantetheinyl transferase family protein [Gammaproteobacteria bacterium]